MKSLVNASEVARLGVGGEDKQREKKDVGETEGAGAVDLKEGVTGADEVRWLAGEGAILTVQRFTNTKSQGQDG